MRQESFAPPASCKRDNFRILVADDNAILLACVQGMLRILGHSVETATNGVEAVELASRTNFDLVILDIQMPEMDGFEAARSLRHKGVDGLRPCIVGMSGESIDRDVSEAAGMDDFLVKPIRLADLIYALEHCSPVLR